MKPAAPPWLGRTDDLSDSARYSRMSPEERLLCFIDVCMLSDAVLSGRPDRLRLLESREPMHPDDEKTWLRLVKESRRAGTDR